MTEKHSGKLGFSRRAFLKGSGAVAAATALHSQSAAVADDKQEEEVVRGETQINLDVNGKKHEVKVEPRTTLLEVLRYQLDLTGAKPVSMEGSSGARASSGGRWKARTSGDSARPTAG
jgi:xanthine dehydrogenase YagT iron-sulfur-binding subunit